MHSEVTSPVVGHAGRVLIDAVLTHDKRLLRDTLAAGICSVIPTHQQQVGGSAVGLCASHNWLDGVRICREAGLDPNAGSMLRDPLCWAYHRDDISMARELLDMGCLPRRPMPDARRMRMPKEDLLTRLTDEVHLILIEECDLDDVDRFVLQGYVQLQGERPVVNTSIGAILLNDPRPRAIEFHQLVLSRHPEIASDPFIVPFLEAAVKRHKDDGRAYNMPSWTEFGLNLEEAYQAAKNIVRN